MNKIYLLLLIVMTAATVKANSYVSCSDYSQINANTECSTEFSGLKEEVCEVCREGKSCFMALDNKKHRGLCQAYIEGKSCFMALDNSDRHWCQVILESASCSHLKSDVDRFLCGHESYPANHNFWRN